MVKKKHKEMMDMFMISATEVRKDWSNICDQIMHEKPQFVKRTRDKMCFFSFELMLDVLEIYQFTADEYFEEDGSITLSLNEIDIVDDAMVLDIIEKCRAGDKITVTVITEKGDSKILKATLKANVSESSYQSDINRLPQTPDSNKDFNFPEGE